MTKNICMFLETSKVYVEDIEKGIFYNYQHNTAYHVVLSQHVCYAMW